ncbi:MAG: hypothetical protein SVY10_07100 [Thermodesulfobacteriota bacterium]|nr:hypothetical protein [Thermodesulfobacteriota bacterium]
MSFNYYTAFGLNIASAIPCPELPAGAETQDVVVRYGRVAHTLTGAGLRSGCYEVAPNRLLLAIEGVARYLVSSGKEILIDRAPDAPDDDVRLFLLGSAFGALLHQRGLLPLHGSAVEKDESAVVFLGHSRVGKSTLAAAFGKSGYRMISDDVAVVAMDGNNMPLILPSYPQFKLQVDAVRKLGEEPESLPMVDPLMEKHALPFQDGFCKRFLPLRRLYVLDVTNNRGFHLRPLKGAEKLSAIINNTYRINFLDGIDRKMLHFKQCVAVAKCAMMIQVTRPHEPFLLNELVELLEDDLQEEI